MLTRPDIIFIERTMTSKPNIVAGELNAYGLRDIAHASSTMSSRHNMSGSPDIVVRSEFPQGRRRLAWGDYQTSGIAEEGDPAVERDVPFATSDVSRLEDDDERRVIRGRTRTRGL